MNLRIRRAQVTAQDIDIADTLVLHELKIDASDISLGVDGQALRVSNAEATLILTEVQLNTVLRRQSEPPLSDLEVAMLTGSVRITGVYSPTRWVRVPFAFTGVPEVESGVRVRLDPRRLGVLGVPVPRLGADVIANRVNKELASQLDVEHLPIPVRLTGIRVEPGRLVLTAHASVELRPAVEDLTPAPRAEAGG